MNLLLSCIGRRGYIADYFRPHLAEGDRIIGTSNTPWTPGFRHCDRPVLLPGYHDPSYAAAVLRLCEEEDVSAVMSLMDEDVFIMAGLADDLRERGVTPVLPSRRVTGVCLDKWQAYEFLVAHGFSTPRTFTSLEQALSAIRGGDIDYPLIVKPRHGFGSFNTFVANDQAQLSVFHDYHPDMLIQELCRGDAYNVDVLASLEGSVVSVVPWRKLQSRLGETEQAVTVEAPALIETSVELVEALDGLVGPMDVDFFVDGGEVQILEMNPRFGGGYPLSHLAGGEFPALIVRMLQGEVVSSILGDYERDIVMMKDLIPFGGPRERILSAPSTHPAPLA